MTIASRLRGLIRPRRMASESGPQSIRTFTAPYVTRYEEHAPPGRGIAALHPITVSCRSVTRGLPFVVLDDRHRFRLLGRDFGQMRDVIDGMQRHVVPPHRQARNRAVGEDVIAPPLGV